MNVIRHSDKDFAEKIRQLLAAPVLFDKAVEDKAREIVEAVRSRGDAALIEFAEKFDGARLKPAQFPVNRAELMAASLQAGEDLRGAIATAAENVAAYCRKGMRKPWTMTNRQGGRVGEKFDPIRRVGIYIPGGSAPLISTAIMTVTLARVAGCQEIVVCTPSDRSGSIHPGLLFAIRGAGATEIYRLGGAQAIAAMAVGTETIRPVQKIFGPGNAYVVAAKRLLFGQVGIDLLPGPSEVLVFADEGANPRFVAADLLAQSEHGSGRERVWLVTTSGQLLARVEREINRQLPLLRRQESILEGLQNGSFIHVRDVRQGIELINRIAPEHCEIMVRQAKKVSDKITAVGAIFLGADTPTALGDYLAGPSHTLPTGGSAAGFSGLTVDQFQRRTSVIEYSRSALKKSLPALRKLSEVEGLDAHGKSAEIRFTRK